jgi:hypothetical protein
LVDDRFTFSFAAALFTVRDRSFPGAGKMGLWTKANSVIWFDPLTTQALP